jgi:chromosome partitioning protein
MAGIAPHVLTFANEKGGTGKSTTAVHVAVALAAQGRSVAALDLDSRQRTLGRYLDNRLATVRRLGLELPMPAHDTFDPARGESFDDAMARVGAGSDFLIIDTPGRDDPYARQAIVQADTLVTPINDSFVDLDLIGEVDAETYRVRKPSFYAELVWNSRTQRAKAHGASVDWVVLRNRMQHIEARNMRRVGEAMNELSRRVGFRVIPGLGERVIYRELFPKGLTLLDLHAIGEVGLGNIAARQELREMIAGLGLPEPGAALMRSAAMAGLVGLYPETPDRGGRRRHDLQLVPAGDGLGQRDAAERGARIAQHPCRGERRRDPRRASPDDRARPSRCGRLGRAGDAGQCRARCVDRGIEAPINGVCVESQFSPDLAARI